MRLSSVLIAGAAAFAFAALTQSAGADSISTGVANWKLVSVESFYNTSLPAPGSPITIPGAGNIGSSAPTITTPNVGWTATGQIAAYESANSLTANPAKWISATANGDQEGVWGWYTFELVLTPAVSGNYIITGALSADNLVDSFTINGNELLSPPGSTVPDTTPSPAIYGFNYTYEFVAGAQTPITLRARVYNESTTNSNGRYTTTYPNGPSLPDATTNPLGFILAGEATFAEGAPNPVPTPAAAFGGFTLLGGLAATRLRRRS